MAAAHDPHMRRWRIWLMPLSILLGVALTCFVITFWVDASHTSDPIRTLGLFFHPNPQAAAATLANAGEVVAAVLAIAITVVAIVVELAANRYTHRITELFVSAPTNFAVMGFFVVTALQCLWVALTFDQQGTDVSGFVPYVGTGVAMAMLGLCLLILLPYFAFVFDFLNPVNVVDRIRRDTLKRIQRSNAWRSIEAGQEEAVRGIEQLADVGLNAMEHKDKGVSMASVDALRRLVLQYQRIRPKLPKEWFRVEGELAHNPDFVSMSPEVLDDVSSRQIWFEMKVLRQYQMIYGEALNRMRDINYLIAINTRKIADSALKHGQEQLFDLVIKFFNTYIRATINARDVRTAYNVLNQYRLLAESAMKRGAEARAVEIARYFKYYGLISFNAKLPFILETAAYDLCRLNEIAFDRKSEVARDLLRIFLSVDKESEGEVQERSLRGVRKAQIKLATYYLLHNDESLARQVFRDMEREQLERLASIRDEFFSVQSREFWEISDRGVNFDYLTPDRKIKLTEFFGWFGDALPMRMSHVPEESTTTAQSALRHRGADESLHDVPPTGRNPVTEQS